MKIVSQSVELISSCDQGEALRIIERAGRVCYKSEGNIKKGSDEKLVRKLLESGHESVIEHYNVTMKFTTDRGVSHELVRHRLASYSQVSTRYCNYAKEKFNSEITVIKPEFEDQISEGVWRKAVKDAENAYMELIRDGISPELARSVLPTCLATEIVVTANIREWRHIIRLRTSERAHPQIRELMKMALYIFKARLPIFFEDFPDIILDGFPK